MKKTAVKSTFKSVLVLFLTFLFLVTPCISLLTYGDVDLDSQIKSKITTTYAILRAKRGYSYDGYCGSFIRDQLNETGVGFVINGGYDGNKWYPNLVEGAETVYGYKQIKFPGNNCLYNIVDELGNEVYNIVISFTHQYGYTDENPGAGHAVFIYAIVDGMVYFAESYKSSGVPEGAPNVMTIDMFCYKYNKSYGDALGAVYFKSMADNGTSGPNDSGDGDVVDIYSLYYEIYNKGTARYLNVYGSKNYDGVSITTYPRDLTNGQQFRLEVCDDAIRLFALCAPSRALCIQNSKAYLYKPAEGVSSDLWYLENMGGNDYVIRLKDDPDYVLTSLGSGGSYRVVLSEYVEGNNNQIWTFSLDSIKKAAAIYSVVWDLGKDVYRQNYSYNQLPVCPVTPSNPDFDFLGWDKEIVRVNKSAVYVANFGGENEYTVTWLFGDEVYVETFKEGEIPEFGAMPEISEGNPDYLMYDALPTAVNSNDKVYRVYYVYQDENGTRYHDGIEFMRGWVLVNGGQRYFGKLSTYMITDNTTIGGVLYKINSDGSLYNGFFGFGNEIRYYVDGLYQTGWQEIEGKTYYFFRETGYMVQSESYVIGGLYREFNQDHSVKPLTGWQTLSGYKYYYIDGVMATGWQTVGDDRYYFLRSDDVYGRMASGWQKIGDKFYYFYAYGSDNYGKLVTEDINIGGSFHSFNEDGTLKTGFCYNNGNTYYMLDNTLAVGWQEIEGKTYYFYKETGIMVTESRYIGGVFYEFDTNGVCLSK